MTKNEEKLRLRVLENKVKAAEEAFDEADAKWTVAIEKLIVFKKEIGWTRDSNLLKLVEPKGVGK
jgi:hypothetical protein